jgi:hypothetical protein
MDKPVCLLRALAHEGLPAAVLLLPAVIAMDNELIELLERAKQ